MDQHPMEGRMKLVHNFNNRNCFRASDNPLICKVKQQSCLSATEHDSLCCDTLSTSEGR